jgi:pilus assembly protein CpaE
MSKDRTQFDDTFDFDLVGDEALGDLPAANDDVFETLDAFEAGEETALKEISPSEVSFEDQWREPVAGEGGERSLPAISIRAFLETAETRELMEVAANDRRMARVDMEISEGGLTAGIAAMKAEMSPNLLIVESHLSAGDMIARIDDLALHCDEGVEVMVIGAQNDIMLYRKLMTRGVSEYIVPPIKPLNIIHSISELFTDPDAPFVGRSIAMVGAKGGVGASTIAHNLAWSIAENARLNTTLVDLDLAFGTTALDFNNDAQQTVMDALRDPDRADDAVIERLLAKVTERLSLFTAPAETSGVDPISPDAYTKVIETVRRNVPYVVLDLPHLWSDWMREALVGADEVVLVCQPDLASLRNGKNIADTIQAARPNDAAPRLVLNMAGIPKRPEIPVKDFATAIGLEPSVVLPFDPHLFGLASNNGQMIPELDPTAKPSLAIDELASLVTGHFVQARKKSLMQKLLGR